MKSSTTVSAMASQIKAELSSYQTLSDRIIYMAYNSVIGKLYRGVIKEVRFALKNVSQGEISTISLGNIEYEDIVSMRCYTGEFKKVSMEFSASFPMTYYLTRDGEGNDTVAIECENIPDQVNVYYCYIPEPVNNESSAQNTNIPITEEYLPMIYAYVRGECYKWVNEDALAAKWLNDYNAQLTGFAAWINELKKEIGT